MSPEQLFNWFEAALWAIMSVLVLAIGARRVRAGRSRHQRLHLIAAPTLLLFGISDVIEVHTGAWWTPWWLLLLKGACLAVLAACGLVLLRPPAGGSGEPGRP